MPDGIEVVVAIAVTLLCSSAVAIVDALKKPKRGDR